LKLKKIATKRKRAKREKQGGNRRPKEGEIQGRLQSSHTHEGKKKKRKEAKSKTRGGNTPVVTAGGGALPRGRGRESGRGEKQEQKDSGKKGQRQLAWGKTVGPGEGETGGKVLPNQSAGRPRGSGRWQRDGRTIVTIHKTKRKQE